VDRKSVSEAGIAGCRRAVGEWRSTLFLIAIEMRSLIDGGI